METEGLLNGNYSFDQLKKYAEDLATIYKAEREKTKSLYTINKEIKKYAEDLSFIYTEEKAKRLELQRAYQDIQKMFMPFKDVDGIKSNCFDEKNEYLEIFGYYKGADELSGDYFNYVKLDDSHYAVIKCDVAGKGVPAALIMVEVATIFTIYFKDWTIDKPGYKIGSLIYQINDILEDRNFKGRFAALIISVINIRTGAVYFCNAGDNILLIYNREQKNIVKYKLPQSPAAGVFPSSLLEAQSGYKTVSTVLKKGDTLFLFTDGLEEARRYIHNHQDKLLENIEMEYVENGAERETSSEEFGIDRILNIISCVFGRREYRLERKNGKISKENNFIFDFSVLEGSTEDVVLALIAVERIFRLYINKEAGTGQRITLDVSIDMLLKNCLKQYEDFFSNPVELKDKSTKKTYSCLIEDKQFDDITVAAIQRK